MATGPLFRFHSFDYDTTTSLGLDGWTIANNMTPSIVASGGPHGENCLQLASAGGAANGYSISTPNNSASLSFGCWFKINKVLASTDVLFRATTSNSQTLDVVGGSGSNGAFYLRSSTGTPRDSATTNFMIPNGGWVHLQVDMFVGNSSNSYIKCRINGIDDVEVTGFSIGVASPYFTALRFNQIQNGTMSVANVWVANGGYRGMPIARSRLLDGDGTITLTPSTPAVPNYTMLDETVLDQNDYVSGDASAFPLTDTYTATNLAETPNQMVAFGIRTVGKVATGGTSPVVLRGVAKPSGGSDDLSSTAVTLGLTATGQQFIWEDHPDNVTGALTGMTGADAETMFNSCEFGVKLDGA